MVEPQPDQVAPGAWRALAVVAAPYLIIAINLTGTNIAFPMIETEFADTSRSTLGWALSGYSIVLATFMLLGGRLADRIGRRVVFFGGVAGFCAASLLTAAAPTAWVFILGRILQGVSGAFVVPSSLALVLPQFPLSRRTSVVAIWASAGSFGAGIAPSLSAVIVDATSWRWVYLLALPIGAAVFAFGPRYIEDEELRSPEVPLDLIGVAIGTGAVGLLAFSIVQGARLGVLHPLILASLAAVALLAPMFVLRCLNHPAPLVNLTLFRVRTVWAANLSNLVFSMTGISLWLLWPLFLTQIWDYSLLRAGLAITPAPIASGITAVLAARWVDRHGARGVIALGSLFPSAAMGWLVLNLDENPDWLFSMLPTLVLFGSGFGLVFSPLNAAALRGVPQQDFGQANAVFNTVRNVGGAVGIALMLAVLGDARPIPFATFESAIRVYLVVALLPAIIIRVFYPRDPPPRDR
ncbi:MAG: MFS transporter [Acidimicrobiales bacterium]